MKIQQVPADARVRALLAANRLPIDDLDDPTIQLFGAFDGNALTAVIGLQLLDGAGLLRSLAVEQAHRERGLGARMCDEVLRAARAHKLDLLWLLTTSARAYFTRRGFEVVPRDQVPSTIRATAQFSSLCPSSATVMRRQLA